VISSVRGPVLSALGSTVVIEVGGVGLAVQVTPATALSVRVGEEVRLATTLVVREDSLTLYGFHSAEELSVFELLTGVTGVGPKSALGVLAALPPAQIAHAVATEDDGVFRKVSGIGPKTAKLIVLSLAGKLSITASSASSARTPAPAGVSASVQAALIGLGWSEKVAAEVVGETLAEASAADDLGVPAVLRLALARLGPAKHAVGAPRSGS
jgi:holliday junction DNA helicase RuvA